MDSLEQSVDLKGHFGDYCSSFSKAKEFFSKSENPSSSSLDFVDNTLNSVRVSRDLIKHATLVRGQKMPESAYKMAEALPLSDTSLPATNAQ